MDEGVLLGRDVRLRTCVPSTVFERLRGSIRLELAPGEAMLLPNATSVHTFGMRIPILVARLDASFRVVDVRLVRPWRFVPPIRRARHVLECHEGTDIRVGDALRLRAVRGLDVRGSGERAGEGQDERRTDRQGSDHDREEAARPRGERDGLSSTALRLDDAEELQQRPHR